MKYRACALMSFLLFVFSSAACAFEPAVHALYTHRGAEAYQACVDLGADFPRLRAADFDALAEGTRAEDETEMCRRITNWHFPHREGMWRKMWFLLFFVKLDQEPIFSRRVEDLHRSLPSGGDAARKEFFMHAGRVLHYIQDMRVPAHVIPVYHGGVVKEGFDAYVFNDRENLQRMTLDRCQAIAEQVVAPCPDCLPGRLASVIKQTEHALTPDNHDLSDNPVARCWREVFWCGPEDRGGACSEPAYPGFGAYVQGENSLQFGEPGTVRCQGELVRFDDNAYRRFFAAGYRSMLDDIVYMLVYTGRLLASASPGGAPVSRTK